MERKRAGRCGTALVTGASGGIGLELAVVLAREGFDLALVARRASTLRELAGDLARRHGVRAIDLPADLSDPASPAALARGLNERGITIDVLVNNAGAGTYGPVATTDLDRQMTILQLNIVALTQLTGLLLPGMLARRRGRILNLASTAAFQPGPLMAIYYASKAYVLHFSEALAEELRGSGVTVTALCPGPTASGFKKAAGMEGTRLSRGRRPAASDSVARAGIEALMRGRPLVIPGLQNRLMALTVRLLPRRLVTRLVHRLNDRPPRG